MFFQRYADTPGMTGKNAEIAPHIVTINAYNQAIEFMGDGSIDLDTDTFKCELHSALTFTATHTQRSDVSASAVATGNGYTSPGQNLASVTWGFSTDKTIFNAGNVSWAASGGSISGDDAVIYDDTHASDLLLCCCSISTSAQRNLLAMARTSSSTSTTPTASSTSREPCRTTRAREARQHPDGLDDHRAPA